MNTFATAQRITLRLQQAGHTAYLAGGWVRDHLLDRESKDIDIATSARPEEVQALFPRHTGLEGKCFGVVRVMEGDETFEVATFRQEGNYQDGRRPDPASIRFVSAAEDAQRRDFTINGLFYDPARDQVIDYVGGEADLRAGILRAIGDPAARLREDKLRLLRAVRFAVNLSLRIEPATWAAVGAEASSIRQISVERIRDELDKIWTGPHPSRGLDLLDQSGLLQKILPDLHALHGVEQPPQFHPEGDVFIHTRLMLSQLKNAPLVLALAVLFHDVGKKPTMKVDETGRIRFNEHETVGARMTERILTELRYPNQIIEDVCACVAAHMTFKDAPRMRISTLKRFLARPVFDLELELHRLDCASSHGDLSIYEFLRYLQATMEPDEIKPTPLMSGHDILALGVPPGRQVGWMLKKLEDAQLEGRIHTREEAVALARKLAAEAS
jgi:poly(A) polymerase